MDYKLGVEGLVASGNNELDASQEQVSQDDVELNKLAEEAADIVHHVLGPVSYYSASYINSSCGVRNEVMNIQAYSEGEARQKMDLRCPANQRQQSNESGEEFDSLKIWLQSGVLSGPNAMASFPGSRAY